MSMETSGYPVIFATLQSIKNLKTKAATSVAAFFIVVCCNLLYN